MVEGCFNSVNPQRWGGIGLAACLVLAAAGCSTLSQYPAEMEHTTLTPLRTGRKPDYVAALGKQTAGRDKVLYAMEMGRVAQLGGDYEASRAAFEKAIAATEEQDDQAVLSASGATAQGAAVLVNDKAIPYRAPSYERTLVHHYQALNFLAANDVTGAGVEVRRANREQEAARERHAKEIAKARSDRSDDVPETERDPQLLPVYAGLDEMAGAVKHSFQNAATFYVSAVIWEMLGEPNDAYIDLKKALEIQPDNPFLQQDVVRLARRLGMREDLEDLVRRFPDVAGHPGENPVAVKDQARLVVVYEEGLAPKKSEMSLAYPLPSANSIGMIALPVYAGVPLPPVPVEVAAGGRALGRTAPVCNVSALAARALDEQMPGILTRQVARAVAKGAAAKAAQDHGGDWGGLIVTLFNLVTEQADLRSWLSLPAHVQVLGAWLEPGTHTVALSAPPGGTLWSEEVTLKQGKTTLICVTRIDLAVYSHVMVQP